MTKNNNTNRLITQNVYGSNFSSQLKLDEGKNVAEAEKSIVSWVIHSSALRSPDKKGPRWGGEKPNRVGILSIADI